MGSGDFSPEVIEAFTIGIDGFLEMLGLIDFSRREHPGKVKHLSWRTPPRFDEGRDYHHYRRQFFERINEIAAKKGYDVDFLRCLGNDFVFSIGQDGKLTFNVPVPNPNWVPGVFDDDNNPYWLLQPVPPLEGD